MTSDTLSDDNVVPVAVPLPDAHGQAAMLLIESLIHGLIERRILSVADAVEIVDVATEVQRDTVEELGETPAKLEKSIQLLQAISDSLRLDVVAG